MILPPRVPIPERREDLSFQDAENQAFEIAFAQGFNAAIDAAETLNMKPDGYYWDHTAEEYKAMLKRPEAGSPHAS